ncbi:MAG: 30S ribosomal protein S6 [Ruminococcaceae bacterium]|nr:30S ribosomal protein S6 [Oscillospiraceae bacterium]MBQ7118748.1 30S ribosomal protein S6 [Oscillospiraceae bacterium]
MAKVTAKYETIFIINPALSEEATAEKVAKFKALIEKNGTLANVDEWGKRRFAYPINDLNEGYYVLAEFECVPSFPAELDRNYKIDEEIMRSIIICKDDIA